MLLSTGEATSTKGHHMIIDITEENFEQEVVQSELPVVIDFWADWCAPCKELEPRFEEVSQILEGRVKCGRIDTAAQKSLRIKFAVAVLPTISVVRNGTFIDVADALMPTEELVSRIERALSGELDEQLARKLR